MKHVFPRLFSPRRPNGSPSTDFASLNPCAHTKGEVHKIQLAGDVLNLGCVSGNDEQTEWLLGKQFRLLSSTILFPSSL
jgi:hypothetical protein